MVNQPYNEPLTYSGALCGIGSQSNEGIRLIRASFAIQCQKRHHCLNFYRKGICWVVIPFLAFLRMLTLQTFKKSLGKRADGLSETEVQSLFTLQCKLADLLFDSWKVHLSTEAKTVVRTHKQNGNYVSVFVYRDFYAIA